MYLVTNEKVYSQQKQLNYSEYSNLNQFNPWHIAPILTQLTSCHINTCTAQLSSPHTMLLLT